MFRASGSGEDVDGLRKQIDFLSSQLLEAQSHKLVLETRLGEKERNIKQTEDALANTMADMKHVRAEAQKSFLKHDKRSKEGSCALYINSCLAIIFDCRRERFNFFIIWLFSGSNKSSISICCIHVWKTRNGRI